MKSLLPQWNISNKNVLLRSDLNVPIKNGKIIDDFRLKSLQPTLDYIIDKNGSIILLTHMGRPKNKDADLSTKNLVPWFTEHGYSITFAKDIQTAQEMAKKLKPKSILLLENLRFFPEEKNGNKEFAKQLSQLGAFYVNDAFGVLHRDDTSVALLPTFFANKTIGLLVEKELQKLDELLKHPEHPFILIIGGKKITDKIPFIEEFLTIADVILLCPAIVFTFMKALGKSVGKSLVDEQAIPLCKKILTKSVEKKIPIIFPVDYQVSMGDMSGPYSFVSADTIPDNAFGISIGPKTVQEFTDIIKQAKTVLFNGAIGFINEKETLEGMRKIFDAMNETTAKTIISGGDSVSAAQQLHIDNVDYLSTGGGATLFYLSRKSLPGLEALK